MRGTQQIWPRFRELVKTKMDQTSTMLLSYFINNGPTTIYRAAIDLSLYFSHAYKKVVKLVDEGLLAGEKMGRSTLYDATLKGIIICLAHQCANEESAYRKMVAKLGVDLGDRSKIDSLFELYALIYSSDAPLSDIFSIISYVVKRCGYMLSRCEKLLDQSSINEIRDLVRHVLARLVELYFGSTKEVCDNVLN